MSSQTGSAITCPNHANVDFCMPQYTPRKFLSLNNGVTQYIYQGWGQIRFIKYKYIFSRSFKYKYKYKYTGENLIKYKYKYKYSPSNTNTNTHWGRDKIAAILQMTYSNSLYCKKIVSNFTENCSKGPIYHKPPLAPIMAWRWVGNKPLSDQWWPSLLMHNKCITRPKWVNVKCSVADCYLNVV